MRHVNADLVSPPGFQRAAHLRRCQTESRINLEVCSGRPAPLDHGHPLAIHRVPANRRIDRAARSRWHAGNEGDVGAFYCVHRELLDELLMRRLSFRNHHDAAGPLVQPMHDAGPALATDAG